MGYYDSQETIVTVTQHWHVRVAARRYFNQAIAEIKERLQPEHNASGKLLEVSSMAIRQT
jgi:UDP-glucose 4-epimerase